MTDEELKKLQRYIGKRSQGQTDEQVIEHIEKLNSKTPLKIEQWESLLYPTCANSDLVILIYILNKLVKIDNIQEYMIHTVRSQEKRYEYILKRIEVLKILIPYIKENNKKSILSETLLTASWYGELGIVKFLIDNGADIRYKDKENRDSFEYAKIYNQRFNDDILYNYLKYYYELGGKLDDIKVYYGVKKEK
ncbi:ankyrin repeat domain-containing protein [Clostridium gasigenes]|uniref:ankyrin repeat domain-containing protein n=1 Tax=Clostridium gasigenes TaxID=94869 RepID=UPI001C0C3688|nr:ankyrin repeat domain-containing protein [Clostridium gasigenes]MBU3103949.1 ankyrin repeat domain-containing protein [Clostridium gasigenes]